MKKIKFIMVFFLILITILYINDTINANNLQKKFENRIKKTSQIKENSTENQITTKSQTKENNTENQITTKSQTKENNTANQKYKKQKMIITMTGDTSVASFFGQKIYFDTLYRQRGAKYFLNNLSNYFENADINITNLENVFTTSNKAIGGKIYTYKSYSKDYIDVLTSHNIMYVNVVNNHMQDYLQKGFDESMQLLDEKGIKYFGTNLTDCSNPELGSVKVHKIQTFQKGDIKIGLAGYYAFASSHPTDKTIKEDIANLKKQGCNFIIVAMHGGGQENNIVLQMQEIMAKKFIDLGADMIYGHHPHAIQRIDTYKGKKIYYSLGNFLFVNYKGSKNPEGLLVQLTLNMDESGKITPTYKNVPIYWMGGYSQKYTPTEITDKNAIQKVNNILNGTIYVR